MANARGEIPEPAAYDAIPYELQRSERLSASSSYLRDVCRSLVTTPPA